MCCINHSLQSPPVLGRAHPMPVCDVFSEDAFCQLQLMSINFNIDLLADSSELINFNCLFDKTSQNSEKWSPE